MPQPYTKADLERGELIVRELHGVKGYDAWAQHIAQSLAAERERCAQFADADGTASVARGLREGSSESQKA